MSQPFSFRGVTVPERTLDELKRYVNDRELPGDFLWSVLANDLQDAVVRADPENFAALGAICAWVHWNAPSLCHGSDTHVRKWLDRLEEAA